MPKNKNQTQLKQDVPIHGYIMHASNIIDGNTYINLIDTNIEPYEQYIDQMFISFPYLKNICPNPQGDIYIAIDGLEFIKTQYLGSEISMATVFNLMYDAANNIFMKI